MLVEDLRRKSVIALKWSYIDDIRYRLTIGWIRRQCIKAANVGENRFNRYIPSILIPKHRVRLYADKIELWCKEQGLSGKIYVSLGTFVECHVCWDDAR